MKRKKIKNLEEQGVDNMENYEKLLKSMQEEHKDLIGISNYETGEPDKIRLSEAILWIDANACKCGLLDQDKMDLLAKRINEYTCYRYMVPSKYSISLQKVGYTKAYNENLKPLVSEFDFNYEDKNCIIYYVNYQEGHNLVLLNKNAMEVISKMPLDDIKQFIMNANKNNIKEKIRNRK